MHRNLPRLLICLLILLTAALLPLISPYQAAALPTRQEDLPSEGWTVCLVGGMLYIPEVGETRQVFEVCHGEGWRYQAYCTQPSVPVPPVGAFCSLFAGGGLWCGEGVQQLQMYAILQTPEATATATATATASPTGTPTPTVTATGTPLPRTSTPDVTATSVLLTETPPILRTFSPGEDRPRPGGPGNLEIAGFVIALAVIPVIAATLILRRRHSARG